MARRERPDAAAFGRRADLRRRALKDYEIPPTEGPKEASDRASLVWMGGPEAEGAAAVEKAAAKFGPKGFKIAKRGLERTGSWAMRKLRPIMGRGVAAAAKAGVKGAK